MMQIEEKKIPVRDLIAGYKNDPDKGVHGYGGRLDIRPPYQREFRYNDKQKQDVIKTILKQYPLKNTISMTLTSKTRMGRHSTLTRSHQRRKRLF